MGKIVCVLKVKRFEYHIFFSRLSSLWSFKSVDNGRFAEKSAIFVLDVFVALYVCDNIVFQRVTAFVRSTFLHLTQWYMGNGVCKKYT